MPAIDVAHKVGATAVELVKRQYGYGYGSSYGYRNTSPWNRYGRWALLGVLLAVGLVAFFLISCLNARRRKKAGNKPFYGTQWLAPNSYGQQQQQQQAQTQYYPPQNTHNDNAQYAPPAYPPTNGPAPNGNADYYGNNTHNNNQYEMQQPAATYQPGYNREAEQAGGEYAPPAGPPPGKAGVFR